MANPKNKASVSIEYLDLIILDSDGNQLFTASNREEKKMIAYKCDRCGKVYEKGNPGSITVSIRWLVDNWERKDLCDDCQRELMGWWNGKSTVPKDESENDKNDL